MISIRIHGRGGQGVVTTAELLAAAAFASGRWPQAVPTFGSERTGAPVTAFCRIDDRPIRSHEPVSAPDVVLVQDPTLLHEPTLLDGLAAEGWLIVNSSHPLERLHLAAEVAAALPTHRLAVPATALAREHLGRPLPGPALLGALAAATGVVGLDAIANAFRERFSGAVAEGNAAAAAAAAAAVDADREAIAHA